MYLKLYWSVDQAWIDVKMTFLYTSTESWYEILYFDDSLTIVLIEHPQK